jgi:hypothetical protein
MFRAKLAALIDSDASNATKTPQQIADWCNARVMPAPVPTGDVIRYLTLVDKWEEIKIAAESADAAAAAKTKAARKMVSAMGDFESFDLSNAQYLSVVTSRLDDLVTHGLITSGAPGDKEIILALGDNKRTRAEAAGLGEVWGKHVADAGRGVL